MIYVLKLGGQHYRCRDEWQALWLARVWVALTEPASTSHTATSPPPYPTREWS